MALPLRQSTASQEILLGRFVDDGDGNTQMTALTINNTDIKIWVEGGTTLASKNSGGATHIANGLYYAVLDATDTATLGKMEVHVHVSGALAVMRQFVVMAAEDYDAYVLGVTYPPVDPYATEVAASGSVLTVKKRDGSTTNYTKTIAGDPAADPITSIS